MKPHTAIAKNKRLSISSNRFRKTNKLEIKKQFEIFRQRDCHEKGDFYRKLSDYIIKHILKIGVFDDIATHDLVPNLFFASLNYLHYKKEKKMLKEINTDELMNGFNPESRFNRFLEEEKKQIQKLINTRHVQTNEVNRLPVILLGLNYLENNFSLRDYHLIDVGTSAGFHLLFNEFYYDYGKFQIGRPQSRIKLHCQCVTEVPRIENLPQPRSILGIDKNPIKKNDADKLLWLKSSIWPDDIERHKQFDNVVSLLRNSKIKIQKEDARFKIVDILNQFDDGRDLALLFAFSINKIFANGRAALKKILLKLSKKNETRRIFELDLSFFGKRFPEMIICEYTRGRLTEKVLCDCDLHGSWVQWH